MTKRSEAEHRFLELKAQVMAWVGNKLFSMKDTGLDGFVKRTMLKTKKSDKRTK